MPRADSRARILTGAQAVFAEKGYRAATVAAMLAEARVARGTFYRYFPGGKFQVFETLVARLFNTLYRTMEDCLRSEGFKDFSSNGTEALTQTFRLYLENRGLLAVSFDEAFVLEPRLFAVWDNFDRSVFTLIESALVEGVERGEVRELDSGLIARVLVTVFYQTPYRDIIVRERTEIDVESMAGEIARLVVGGLSPSGGRAGGR